MIAYDGNKHYEMAEGDYSIARRNHLIRYTKHKQDGAFEKIIITLDEAFLRKFLEKHIYTTHTADNSDSFIFIREDKLIHNFIQSLEPYYNGSEQIDAAFADVKREELLIILLKNNPWLANVFFNFSVPQAIDVEAFMLRNFRFNISLDRFALLTGRSLSSFKRDFKKIFGETPGRWLTKKRLEEAYFLIKNENKSPSEVYLDAGFENLSHFSFVFKKKFGISPAKVMAG